VAGESTLTVVLVYPEVLGTYGDRGNAIALAHRARGRGLPLRVLAVERGQALPTRADIYLIGGGEDAATVLAWRRLRDEPALPAAVAGGAVCFGVCAGYQLLARSFTGPDGQPRQGLGLLDVTCARQARRAVGEVLAESGDPRIGFLTGFENHQGDARLGAAARPLGRLVTGVGNGDGRFEGAVQGHVVGTYLHGPALVRNDGLADRLLELVAGPLAPYDDEPVRRLRQERRAAALASRRPRWRRRGR